MLPALPIPEPNNPREARFPEPNAAEHPVWAERLALREVIEAETLSNHGWSV